MKYDNLILQSFNKFNLTPRQNQIEIINKILNAYIDKHKKYVVLSASTGWGKSIIAVITAECLHQISPNSTNPDGKSFILMHNKTLQEQYVNTFSKYSEFINVLGANNYNCRLLRGTADDCILKKILKNKNAIYPPVCKDCNYLKTRNIMDKKNHIITNYSYFFLSTMYTRLFSKRTITVFDEAHIINDIFCSHMTITLSSKMFDAAIDIVKGVPLSSRKEFIENLEKYKKYITYRKIHKGNYMDKLEEIFNSFEKMSQEYASEAEKCVWNEDHQGYKTYNRISKRFYNYKTKYDDLKKHNYEHVIDIQPGKVVIQPIFLNDMFSKVENSKYFLFMSATLDESFIETTLKIKKKDVEFIKVKSTFDPSSKKIIFLNHASYNYKNMNDLKVLEGMGKLIEDIIEGHTKEKGIILTPSFKINETIIDNIKYKSKRLGIKLFIQKQGTHLKPILEEFKEYEHASLLISPSLFEGIDMVGDLSTYQIMVKAPYASFADKRIEHILKHHPNIYKIQTIYKIIQGFGRSTRNEEDKSITYALDNNIHRLFKDTNNLWKNEFEITTL